MSYTIITLAMLAMLHFVYEGIILPSVRLKLRFQLFALRDRLRSLRLSGTDIDNEVFSLVHHGINVVLERLHAINLHTMYEAERVLEIDQQTRDEIDRRNELITSCGVDDVIDVHRGVKRIVRSAFCANSGGWMIYIVPIAAVAALCSLLHSVATLARVHTVSLQEMFQRFRETCGRLVDATEAELNRIFPRPRPHEWDPSRSNVHSSIAARP